jgi:transcriptional regulator with XRE-family HTH domain
MRYLSSDYSDICRPIGCQSIRLMGVDDRLRRLGQRIRELRSQKGWSQEAFADVCHVHRTYMGHLERGEKNVSFSSLTRLAESLDITLSQLLAGVDGDSGAPVVEPAVSERRTKPFGHDRERLLRELANLERAATNLRTIFESSAPKRKQNRKR